MQSREDQERNRLEARAEAAELELERAHRLLDEYGLPREFQEVGVPRAVEYSLQARIQLLLDSE